MLHRVRKNRIVKHGALFGGMFVITTTLVGLETGSLASGLCVACFASPLKYGWAAVHSLFFGSHA